MDIERIIKERDVSAVEENIPFVCEYKLDSEQAAILDKTFVNMFRIGQLSVDYLLFCRMYLDHTVINLKQEITTLNEVKNPRVRLNILKLDLFLGKQRIESVYRRIGAPDHRFNVVQVREMRESLLLRSVPSIAPKATSQRRRDRFVHE